MGKFFTGGWQERWYQQANTNKKHSQINYILGSLTKDPFDESEKEEWKSWLKAQHSEN